MRWMLALALMALTSCSDTESEEPECWYLDSPDSCAQCTDPEGCPNLFQIMSCGPDTTGRAFPSEDECVAALDCGGCGD